MITTLRTGALTLDTAAEYKFSNGLLTIKLTTDGAHGLYGDVNIELSNVEDIDIKKIVKKADGSDEGLIVEDYFNQVFKFSRTSADTLEFSERIESGIDESASFIDLPAASEMVNVEADVDNASFDLPAGSYNFLLLDTEDSDFSTSKISIKLLNVGDTGEDSVESLFDELGEGDYLSINNQDLHFQYPARVSIHEDDANTTNIPLVINEA